MWFADRGIDTCFLVNRDQDGPYDWREKGPVATLHSAWSGIQVDVFSDQEAYQIYTCSGQNGRSPSPQALYIGQRGCRGMISTSPTISRASRSLRTGC